jgi:hypothetical protein
MKITRPLFNTIILLFPVLLFSSCCRTKTAACVDPVIEPSFVGYSMSDIDTMIIRMYKANDNFNTLLDTFKIANCSGSSSDSNSCYSSYYTASSDTINIFIQPGYNESSTSSNLYCQIRKGYDWSIYMPSIDQADSISNITIEQETGSLEDCCCKAPDECPNKITSLKINETVIDSVVYSYGPGFVTIFIHK